jgi:3'-phosphoadenosine 5'-phosphosulfate sulfotransferase (PAPS reductase)/FAD synthetase
VNNLSPKIAGILKKEPAILLFSTGKDSIVIGDLLFSEGFKNIVPVFLYFVKDLSIKQKIITYYEKRWNVKIEQRPHPRALNLKQSKKKYKMSDVEKSLRAEFNISWIIDGAKKTDSMARRGLMARLQDGVDERNLKIYPLADWNDTKVMAYIKLNRLMLPLEYNHGFERDFNVPTISKLVYLKNNFNEDYKKIIAEFPDLESMVWAEEN